MPGRPSPDTAPGQVGLNGATLYGVQLLDQYREQYGSADTDHTDDTTDNPSL